jgi:hypothetical protein
MAAARAKTRRSGGSWGGDKDKEDLEKRVLGGDDSFNPNDINYTGGTPTEAYAYAHPVEKAAGRALPIAVRNAMPNLVPPVMQRGGLLGPDSADPEDKGLNVVSDQSKELIEATVYKGMEAADWVWSNTIARTASASAIVLGDVLDGGEFKATPKDAWNRGSQVSFGQAAVDAQVGGLVALHEIFGVPTNALLKDADVDIWSDSDIARAQQQVYAYSTVTGLFDTALNLTPIPLGKGVGAAARAAGVSKTISRGQFDRMYREGMRGIEARQPQGAPVRVTGDDGIKVLDEDGNVEPTMPGEVRRSGRRIEDEWNTPDPSQEGPGTVRPDRNRPNDLADEYIVIADSTDRTQIMQSRIVKRQTAVDPLKLASILSRVSDPEQVLRIHLAVLGDVKSAAVLFKTLPAEAWQLSGVADVIKKAEPETFIPMNESMDVAFYQSMDDFDKALYDALITDGGFAAQGRKTIATGRTFENDVVDATLGAATRQTAKVVEAGSKRAAERRAAIRGGDFDKYMSKRAVVTEEGRVEYRTTTLGRAGALTQILDFSDYWANQWANRTRRTLSSKPLNVFSYARTRPTDLIDEFYAMAAESEALRVGDSVLDEFGKPIKTEVWIRDAVARLSDASVRSTGELKATFQALQMEMVYQIGRKKGLTNEEIAKFFDGFNTTSEAFMQQVRSTGKYIDTGTSNVIQFDPRTIRELANSEITVPLQQLAQYLDTELGKFQNIKARTELSATFMYDIGAAAFRTGMLLKPGYVARNAVFEPGVTAIIAHMGAAPGLLFRDAAVGTVRWFHNRLGVNLPSIFNRLDTANKKRAMKKQISRYRHAIQARDNLVAELDAYNTDVLPPSMMGNEMIIMNQLDQINTLVTNLLHSIAEIDGATARELVEAVDYEYTSKVARGAREILKGSDEPLVKIREEIAEWEELPGDGSVRFDEADFGYLDRLYTQQAIFEAIIDARRSGMSRGARKAGDDTKTRAAGSNVNEKLIGHVQSLLEKFSINDIERTFIPEFIEDNMSGLGDIARQIREASIAIKTEQGALRTAQERYARSAARGDRIQGRRKRAGEQSKKIKTTQGDVDYEGPFSGPVGDAYREDASGHITALNNFAPMGGESSLHRTIMSRMDRLEFGIISPTDPVYFDELYYYATRTYATEPIVAPAFTALTREARVEKIIENIMADAKYRAEMGLKTKRQVEEFAGDTVDAIDDMFPSTQAKELIGSGKKFGPGELADAILADPNAVLKPIDGQQLKPWRKRWQESVKKTVSGAFEAAWRAIAITPESVLGRWPYYARQHELVFKRKMEDLGLQGKISVDDANAARVYAHRETLSELEKVFYTIRRYNRGVFSSRFFQTFPGAWANGIYRYMYYLPTRYTGEVTSALLIGKDIVDEMIYGRDGEQADFWDEDAVMLVNSAPGVGKLIATANERILGKDPDEGIRLEKNALMRTFSDLPPGRSYLQAFSVDALLMYAPGVLRNRGQYDLADDVQGAQQYLGDALEQLFGDRDAFGIGQVTDAALFGDYGPTKEFVFGGLPGLALGSITPGYARSFVAWMTQEASKDWMRIANYQIQKVYSERTQDENKSDVDFESEIARPTTEWFKTRFLEQWLNMDMGGVRMPNYPGQVYRDEWRQINADNPDLEFEKKVELLEEAFPDVDPRALMPFTKSTSRNTYGVAPSREAYGEVERFPDAARAIANIGEDGSTNYYVGLLAMDQKTGWGESSQLIYNVMQSDAPFQGGRPYRETVPPEQYNIDMKVGLGWDEFTATDEYLDVRESIARDAKDKEEVKRIQSIRRDWLHNPETGMKVRHPEWYNRYIDPSAKRHEQVSNIIQNFIIDDPKVWARKSQDPAWIILKDFLATRAWAVEQRAKLGDTKEDRAEKYRLDQIMIDNYGVIMGQSEYPMLKDLWDTVYEPQYDSEYVKLLEDEEAE